MKKLYLAGLEFTFFPKCAIDFSTPAKFIPSVFLSTGTTRPERDGNGRDQIRGVGWVLE